MSARPAPITERMAVEHYREGETLARIARRYGVGVATVWRRLRSAGEPTRRAGRRERPDNPQQVEGT